MKNIIQSVKGTREFYPPEMALRKWMYGKITEVSHSFGYQEYDGPFLESIELYAAKSGEELVKEQSFVFPDRGGNLITLRPELTPSLARMIAQRQNQLVYPIRWWSFGPFWRYEKPQKGRTREFFQWNIDLIGVDCPEGDAELVAIAAEFFKAVNLTSSEVKILVNDRRLMDQQMVKLGVTSMDQKKSMLSIIDRRDKLSVTDWESYVLESGFTSEQLDGLKAILNDKELYKSSPEVMRFFNALEALGVADYVVYDPRVVRGLDYYTGIVFEARDVSESSRAILGGGHYGNLVEEVGGDSIAGVGFAMGDVVLPLILEEFGKLPELVLNPAKVLVTVFNAECHAYSLKIATKLREAGINVLVYPEIAKIGKQFKYADRVGVQYVIVAGPDERDQEILQIKDMQSGEQSSVKISEVVEAIKKLM
ncbi:histidine--tRNA ligase [Pelolinea submarina]|uniref:Histidine--tRNA ligase n=1 Tax=Pelolinea submarina TaxID=913107 RepID=A0A347ZTP7_9CHLR|nr:histidine--tRNA ligase [Pelolinea submarina]REG10742.1 histidyl-tRNA synthetase [Pelolinea submarina]BBB48678.1 histidyl-tRNA synthetase [Pelolinea submarina]